ncbi:uncharacterized protein LY89DRAFT_117893 [Mollisia scopiformis]|uniref:2EXR domain-containing protein n=1 Tax=Mollisia scopiformis TaxID=149040 RepID=A0A194X478_MOLSC|nr:uncharacterized protein LY89DRAFT_117893 [Mollisia scopiformis]KUJ14627.1 hypothetical protein LY89DRAFT_117893 [Mollisia scopiformis]
MDICPTTSINHHTPMSNTSPEFTLFRFLPTELRLKIYDLILALPPSTTEPRRILKISYSPSLSRYISATPPPTLLHLSHEARTYTQNHYTPLLLGSNAKSPTFHASIPISFLQDTLYLSSLSPLLFTHLHDILFHLSTSPSRHQIQSLAIDLRCWSELIENGFGGLLARMRGLKEVLLVVEFGRVGCFRGVLGFLEVPSWRGDLYWLAETAEMRLKEERLRVRKGGKNPGDDVEA